MSLSADLSRGRIIAISTDLLFPAIHGGRLAVLGQCKALLNSGFTVSLIVFHRDRMSNADRARHLEVSPDAVFVKRKGFLRTLIRHPLLPYQAGSRTLSRAEVARLIDLTKPIRAIMAHQEWTLKTAGEIMRLQNVPIVLCSQNDEVKYLISLIGDAYGVRKIYFQLELARLKLTLKSMLRLADLVTVLGDADKEIYERNDKHSVLVRPILTEVLFDATNPTVAQSAKIIFVGSLDLPHAAAGVLWFVRSVMPLILTQRPDAVFHVAGRNASDTLTAELRSSSGVIFHGAMADLSPLYDDARIFINPIFAGSGVNMKMGLPSELGLPIVTTTIGARGLASLASGMVQADDPSSFAKACENLLGDDDEWSRRSHALRDGIEEYSAAVVGRELATIVAALPEAHVRRPSDSTTTK